MTDVELEKLIDERGLAGVLESIAGICGEKADHIRASYLDETLADNWDSASIAVTNCAGRVSVRRVSRE
ncbi:MAG: hypothetical protein ACREXP_00030 [Steroidobacteraceae bacterium]